MIHKFEISKNVLPIDKPCYLKIETHQLIFSVNQLTGVYMLETLVFNGSKDFIRFFKAV